jgi:7,8-dihydro-6-hydroxymethylpterin dimethyltransferase
MSRLEPRDETYFTTVRGMCRRCRQVVPARVFFRGGSVWQQALCPTCTNPPAMIASDQTWYLRNVLRPMPDRAPLPGSHPPRLGCPHDCGPCAWHASPCQLPVVSITNACNLDCPICFTYNRPDRLYHMGVEEMQRTVDWIVESSGGVDLINITGGEPTLHPRLLDLLACCRRPQIGRVTMNSNGLRLAEDRDLCRRLAELGVYVILSLNTFDPAASVLLHGQDVVAAKLRALDNLTAAGVPVTLLNVMVRDVNEDAVAGLLDLLRTRENVLSLTVQTMTYTGQGGGQFPRGRHIPADEGARIVAEHSGGQIEAGDFVTRPAAHPLCYQVCYLLRSAQGLLPLTRLAGPEKVRGLLGDSYLARLDDADGQAFFTDAINELYAAGNEEHTRTLRELVARLYPPGPAPAPGAFQRHRLAEAAVRTVYVHAHMDEDTFDCSRAMMCPDLVPAEPGRLIPACTYNLFYRMQDDRFHVPK